jgi:hypothetical protein
MSLDSTITQLKDLAANATADDRVKIDKALQDIRVSIENPMDSLMRMGNAVRCVLFFYHHNLINILSK